MSYVKISDPAIIDIAAWHQLIQVVNQHGDAIAAITNNFGSSLTVTNTQGDDWRSTFDLGSQMIHFGRAKLDNITNDNIEFPISFSAKPVVIAQYRTDIADRRDFVVTTANTSNSSFDLYIRKPNHHTDTSGSLTYANLSVNGTPIDPTGKTFNIDWIAIGPK